MKMEISNEEKARRYDEAVINGSRLWECGEITRENYEYMFPELKESEDEKIRKSIIAIINNYVDNSNTFKPEMIAWLEKQAEQKSTLPKWKYKKDHTPLLRDSLILNKYGCVAKSPSGALISDVWVIDYAELAKLPKEELEKQGEQKPVDVRTTGYWHVEDVEQKPAEEYNITGISSNKSQGKLGEIIKNLKTTWSEEDENYHRICLDLCTGMPNGGVYAPYIKDEAINWLKSIKDRVQPQQEWSEDTQQWIDAIIFDYESWYDADKDHRTTILAKINILKSLKDRYTWKPSDEQMEALKDVRQGIFRLGILESLYNDLKKLKG